MNVSVSLYNVTHTGTCSFARHLPQFCLNINVKTSSLREDEEQIKIVEPSTRPSLLLLLFLLYLIPLIPPGLNYPEEGEGEGVKTTPHEECHNVTTQIATIQ